VRGVEALQVGVGEIGVELLAQQIANAAVAAGEKIIRALESGVADARLLRAIAPVVLRQEHQPGEKGFVDWAGATIPVHDPVSGEIWPASLFVIANPTFVIACARRAPTL